MEAYLGGEEIPAEKLAPAFAKAMVAGHGHSGVVHRRQARRRRRRSCMDAVGQLLPVARRRQARPVAAGEAERRRGDRPSAADPAKPFVGQAFKITTDPFVGKLAWIRVLQGTCHAGHDLPPAATTARPPRSATCSRSWARTRRRSSRPSPATSSPWPRSRRSTAATCCTPTPTPMFRDVPAFPTPMYSLAIEPKSRGDEQKISEALTKLAEEDPTFVATRDAQTHETVISGMGDLHLRIMLTEDEATASTSRSTPSRRRSPTARRSPPRPRATTATRSRPAAPGSSARSTCASSRWSAADGLRVRQRPLRRVDPAAVPPGHREGRPRRAGQRRRSPATRCRTSTSSVYDGKHHPVDSKEVAFRTAGKCAFIDAIEKAKPVLLEPIVNMEITVPANFMGDITGDLSGRRGRIMGMDMLPGNMRVDQGPGPAGGGDAVQQPAPLASPAGRAATPWSSATTSRCRATSSTDRRRRQGRAGRGKGEVEPGCARNVQFLMSNAPCRRRADTP